MKNNKNKYTDTLYYTDVLEKEEIFKIGSLIRRFEKKQIAYQGLKEALSSLGVKLKPHFINFSTKKMTLKMAEELKIRLKDESFIPSDLNGYYISNELYKDVLIRYDRTMIEVLAEYGDLDAQKTLISLLKWEKSHGSKTKKR